MILLYTSLFLLFWSVCTYHKQGGAKEAFFVVFVVMVCTKTFVDIYALPDLESYYAGYEELSRWSWWEVPWDELITLKCPEIGFRYLLKIGAFLGGFRWSLFIIAVAHVIAYIKLADRYSPYVMISMAMFLLDSVQSFFVLRQHLAIAITLCSYPYIISRDWKKFFLLLLLAFSFHQTALVFMPAYFLYGIKNRKNLLVVLGGVFVSVYVSFVFIFNFFATYLVGYESYMDLNEGNKTTLAISFCYLVSYVFFLRKDIFADGINRLVFILLAFNLIVISAGYTFSAINRLMMYYAVVNIISVPITMVYIKVPIIRYVYCASILFLLMYLFYSGSNAEYLNAI